MKSKILIPFCALLTVIIVLPSFQLESDGIPTDDVICTVMEQTPCAVSDSVYLADHTFGSVVSWRTSNCDELPSENLKSVVLSFENKTNRRLVFVPRFKNIRLIEKKSGNELAPIGIHMSGKKYTTSISFGRLTNFIKSGRRVQMILLFPQAEKGDQIVIDKFVNAEIR